MRIQIVRVAILICAAARLYGQQPSAPRQAFAAITVADLDATVRWYDTHLGTRRVSGSRAPSGVAENTTVANDYLMVEIIHFTAKAPSDTVLRSTRDVGLQKVGVWVDKTTFDAALAQLQGLNAAFVGGVFTDAAIKARMFIVKDNSGVLIQFFTPS